MVYREKVGKTVTRLTGSGLNQDTESPYWEGSAAAETASTTSGWTSHTKVPTVSSANDPRTAFTPIAGGIQFNYPGTYEVEVTGNITGGAVGAREGILLYTSGGIVPSIAAAGQVVGGDLIPVQSIGSARYFTATILVSVTAAGAAVKFQDYVQTATSHTCTLTRIRATKIVQGGPGPQGIQGIQGPTGPKGTRWGYTHIWAYADSTDIACTMYDGNPPAVGDLLVSLNGFSVGEIYTITAVYPGTNNVDVNGYSPALNLKGPPGTAWGTTTDYIVGGAGTLKANVLVNMQGGAAVKGGDLIISQSSAAPGDVYTVYQAIDATHADLKKLTPELNIRGPAGPAGGVLAQWPIDSVYISFANTNPATLFGGTWVSIGAGRMLIGVDSTDTAMDAAGETGGSKTVTLAEANLPPHTHTINHDHADATTTGSGHTHTFGLEHLATTTTSGTALRVTDIDNQTGGTGTNATATTSSTGSGHTHNIPSYSGSSGAGAGASTPVNNLPPYLAVYMWRRTA